MRNNRLIVPCVLMLVQWFAVVFSVVASEPDSSAAQWGMGGHVKYQYVYTHVPQDSVFHSISGDNLQDHNLEARLKISARRDSLDFERSDLHGMLRMLAIIPLTFRRAHEELGG